jgi:Na+/melibiose symporter-like transporter
MSNRRFLVLVSVLLLLGLAAGYRLSTLPRLETYKLLNVAGLSYSLLGMLVLSELLASATWKRICVKFLAPAVLWLHSLIPLGAFVGAFVAKLMHKPSWEIVCKFFIGFFTYSLIPLSVLNEFVVWPQLPSIKRDIEARWRLFGLFLLSSGVAVQLVAAILAVRGQ